MPSKQGPRLYWRLSNLQHPHADLDKTIQDHLLNHAVQVLFPYQGIDKELQEELDVQLATMLPPDEGYQVIRASLADIVAQVLNSQVLQQEGASLQALSLADRLESGHAAAITPDGVLHLALSAELFARLGLQGTRSAYTKERYNVSLDLRDKSLQPGADRYAQVLGKLRACLPQQAFLLRLEVQGQLRELGLPREALTPSYGTEAWMPLQSEGRTQPGLTLPPLSRETFERHGAVVGGDEQDASGQPRPAAAAALGAPADGGAGRVGGGEGAPAGREVEMAAAEEGEEGGGGPGRRRRDRAPLTPQQEGQLRRAITGLHTWLGSLACAQGHEMCNDLLPEEVMPLMFEDAPLRSKEEEERLLLGTVVSRLWRGMLSQGQVQGAMQAASSLVASGRVPWAAVHVWGFADTPVAWRGMEHGIAWGGAGESGFSVLLLPGGDYCVFKPMGAHEVPA